MASTFSPSLRIELIGNGDQSGTWGTTTNNNLGTLIEQAIAGVVTITMVDTAYTLTNFNGIEDEARNQVIVASGVNTAVRDIIIPLVEKTYTIKNSTTGGFGVRVIGASGTGVTVPNGVTTTVYCDGTNVYAANNGTVGNFAINGAASVTGALSGTTATFSGAISSVSPTFTGTPTAPTASFGNNTTQIATTAFVLANGLPTGSLVMWTTTSAPSGFLLCDGSAVSRTTYSALFAVVGTTFGSGDGSTTFNVPNYTNRMPYGTTVGATGGSADAIVVSHTHTATSVVVDPGHSHTIQLGGDGFAAGNSAQRTINQAGNPPTSSVTTGITVNTTNATTGSSGVGANLPPYLGINFVIKF